jgi:hypothetical protein
MKLSNLFAFFISIAVLTSACTEASQELSTTKNGVAQERGAYSANAAVSTANASAQHPEKEAGFAANSVSVFTDKLAPSDRRSKSYVPQAIPKAPVPTFERKIIRNADLTLEADSAEEAQHKITFIAESNGGYVVESQQSSVNSRSSSKDFVAMKLRVPSSKFESALDEIRKTSKRVVDETLKGEDVSEEFVDLESRIKAKKALEAQFQAIMKRANSVDDALSVQAEIGSVREEIEQLEGRRNFLADQSSFSTISIRIQTETATAAANPNGFFSQLRGAFDTGLNAALVFISWFVTLFVALLPFAILIGLPLYGLIRYFQKRQRKENFAREIAREEIGNS